MCGIAGIVRFDGNPVNPDSLARMVAAAAHRGPDDAGQWIEGNVGLGHRRLSIVDLTSAGHQPMEYLDRYVLTYNGEIYNYLELRAELAAVGYQFRSRTDSEVLLAAYDHWGESCVERFNGMWGFALLDRRRRIMFCSRDRFGVKPFHYVRAGQEFAFSSEIRQLLTLLPRRVANSRIVADYLWLGLNAHDEETFFAGVLQLRGGHNLAVDLTTGQIRVNRYYTLRPRTEPERMTPASYVDLLRTEFERSIGLRLRSDVRVGTCLSGGLDSSSIATVAAHLYRNQTGLPFFAITGQSTEPAQDETHYAQMVAEDAGLDWRVVRPDESDFKAALDDVIQTQEEPFRGPSVFMQYFVMQAARAAECPVLLDGQGSDEMFGGYENYRGDYLASLLMKGRVFAAARAVANMRGFKIHRMESLFHTAYAMGGPRARRVMGRFRRQGRSSILRTDPQHHEIYRQLPFTDFLMREITVRSLPRLLRYEDRNSMRFSIETRLPFLDFNVVETALGAPEGLRMKSGFQKYPLRQAIHSRLRPEIAWRTNKLGFEAPAATWIASIRTRMEAEIVASPLLAAHGADTTAGLDVGTLWRRFNLARWASVFGVEQGENVAA